MPPRPNRRETLGLALAASGAAMGGGAARAAVGDAPAFTLLLVNDVYAMGEVEGRGGFARLNAVVRQERARGVPVLYCHAGDTLSPSLMSGLDRGAHVVALLNLAPPDVFVPGNHEFDFGPEIFAERMREARFPWFAANLRDADGRPLPASRDGALIDLGGVRVGVVGIALEATPQKSQSGPLRFAPEIATLADQARDLRLAGAELVVGVAHTARDTDEAIVRGRIVDILLSGHDHDLALRYDGQTVMAESGHDAQVVTAIDVRISRDGPDGRLAWQPSFRLHDTRDVTPDPETLALVRRLEGDLARELDVPLTATEAPLDSRVAAVRAAEASFGSLVADALRAAADAEVGLMNGGGVRGNRLYPAGGTLTRRDVLTELPFGNTLALVEIDGRTLRAALENGYLDLGRPSGRFLQVSGLTVTLDPSAPPGRRVAAVAVGGAPLDEGRTYRVAANNFMLEGGNGYGMLRAGRVLLGATDGPLVANAVMAYLRARAPLPAVGGARILLR